MFIPYIRIEPSIRYKWYIHFWNGKFLSLFLLPPEWAKLIKGRIWTIQIQKGMPTSTCMHVCMHACISCWGVGENMLKYFGCLSSDYFRLVERNNLDIPSYPLLCWPQTSFPRKSWITPKYRYPIKHPEIRSVFLSAAVLTSCELHEEVRIISFGSNCKS